MSKYIDGRRAETELVEKLYDFGFFALRIFGSGRRSKKAQPDVLGSRPGQLLFFQVKRTKDKGKNKIYILYDNVEKLYQCAELAGAEAYLACKFPRQKIRIEKPENLETTPTGAYIFSKDSGIPISEFLRSD